jgi:hypothetical protein
MNEVGGSFFMFTRFMARIIRSIRPVPLEKSLAELRNQLSWIDWHPPNRLTGRKFRLILLRKFQGIRIRMDATTNGRMFM